MRANTRDIVCAVGIAISLCLCGCRKREEAVPEPPSTKPVTPPRRTGLWIISICGRGCEEPRGPCDVYVLPQTEFDKYKKEKDQKVERKGKTPLLVSDIKPGVYYVGIRCVVDTSVVKMKTYGLGGMSRPAYEEFFADDLPKLAGHMAWSGSEPVTGSGEQKMFRLCFGYRKWYKATVEEGKLTPVVALFLEKQSDPKSWTKYYPSRKLFTLGLPPRNQTEVWDSMDDRGSSKHTVSVGDRKILTSLLLRGGRICLPDPEIGTVRVTREGLLDATRRIPSEAH